MSFDRLHADLKPLPYLIVFKAGPDQFENFLPARCVTLVVSPVVEVAGQFEPYDAWVSVFVVTFSTLLLVSTGSRVLASG